MPIEFTTERPDVNARRIINGEQQDVVQLEPMKHTFAWDYYNTGNANHWLPTEIGMQKDVEQWKSPTALTEDERHAFETVLGFFTTADSIAANNIVMAFYKHITSPECRLYLLRQAYEEAIHTHAYQYMVESLGLDSGRIFNMYREHEDIYDGPFLEKAPDLVAHQTDGVHMSEATGTAGVHHDTGRWEAENIPPGIFAAVGPDVTTAGDMGTTKISDIAPTILQLMDCAVPTDMDGEPIAITDGDVRNREPIPSPHGDGEAEQDEEVRERLEDLGYLS